MRLVLSWLREFVDVKASAEDVAATLALRGFEVASIEALDGGDAVIDFEVTANRPDALSVLGLAREVATAYDLPLQSSMPLASIPVGTSDRVAVSIDDAELCPRFAAAVAEVKMGSSPAWMTARLQAAGVRPISNLVDITNYVNLELGQPMHAYDLARLAGASLTARRAKPGESTTTLDGVERKLDADMLVIADRDRAQGIAGVMGGAASEVSASTATVVFEAAYFKPASIRRTSKRLGLKTEASSRFERGADPNAQPIAIRRAIALMQQIGAGQPVGSIVDVCPRPRNAQRLHLRRARLALLLGAVVPDAEVVRILRGLGLEVETTSDGWDVVAPTFRVDLLREVDLIEEAGRHYGFDKLGETFPVITRPALPPDRRIPRDRLVRRVLGAAGFSEAVTFGFIEASTVETYTKPQSPQNTQSNEFSASSAFSAVNDDRHRQPALGEVRHAAPIAAARSGRCGRAQPSSRPPRRPAVRARHAFRAIRRDAQRGASPGRAPASASTGRAERETSISSTSKASSSTCAARWASRRAASRCGEPFLVAGQTAAIVAADGPERGARLGLAGQLAPAVADARGLPRQDRVFVAEIGSRSRRARRRGRERRPRIRSRDTRLSFAICRSSSQIPCLRKSFVAPFWRQAAMCRRH